MNHLSQSRSGKVSQHSFAMVPRPDVPRSVFNRDFVHKTTFNAGKLIPLYVDEILPGDSVTIDMGHFTRVTPNAFLFPMMDNIYLDAFFFFVPTRLVWTNFKRFMGERTPNTDSTTDFLAPVTNAYSGSTVGTIGDYMGLPSAVQLGGGTIAPVSLPARCYYTIWNEWFRDQNMQNVAVIPTNDGPDSPSLYSNQPLYRGKRHDYFAAALPFAQKGQPVTIPLGATAPVRTSATPTVTGAQPVLTWNRTTGVSMPNAIRALVVDGTPDNVGKTNILAAASSGLDGTVYPNNLYADLSSAVAAHVNTMREAVAMQQYLEKDARGGTRYIEKVFNQFGVQSPDARQQRPEYIGGGTSRVNVTAIAQTSETADTPLGQLSGSGIGTGHFRATYSSTEHGYIIGMVSVRADLTYQQGLHRMFTRRTVYDYPWPSFMNLGEQPVYRKEIYAKGTADDDLVFGYQPRFDEFRYKPSMITGRFRSMESGTLDGWHLSQWFTAPPVLNAAFIQENPPMSRVVAGGTLATTNTQEFLCDAAFRVRHVRPMPMYAVPGLNRF